MLHQESDTGWLPEVDDVVSLSQNNNGLEQLLNLECDQVQNSADILDADRCSEIVVTHDDGAFSQEGLSNLGPKGIPLLPSSPVGGGLAGYYTMNLTQVDY